MFFHPCLNRLKIAHNFFMYTIVGLLCDMTSSSVWLHYKSHHKEVLTMKKLLLILSSYYIDMLSSIILM